MIAIGNRLRNRLCNCNLVKNNYISGFWVWTQTKNPNPKPKQKSIWVWIKNLILYILV